MKAIVLLNRAAGTLAGMNDPRGEGLGRVLSDAGIEAVIQMVPGNEMSQAARSAAASGCDVVVAGGGDGTISAVAGALCGTQMPLGILPLGTFNHFAKDLGIPLDLAAAVGVIAEGHVQSVDVAELNGVVFINNSSLGVYPLAVVERESQRKHQKLRKWTAMLLAALKVFRRFPLVRVSLAIGTDTLDRKTPLVFVGNNRYDLDIFKVGKRTGLDRGELCLYIANTQSRWGMILLTVRAMFGRLKQARDFETYALTSCRVETRRKRLDVAMDGEVNRLNPPFEYRIRPQALRVCLPKLSVTESPQEALRRPD